MDNLRSKTVFVIVFAVIVFIFLMIYAGIDDILVAFYHFKWYYIPLILVLISLNYIIRFFKWNFYLNSIGIKIKRKDSMIIFLSGFIMSITPAKLGEVFKAYLLQQLNNTDIKKSAPIILAERITDMIAIIILASIGISVFRYGEKLLLISMISIILMILVIQSKSICLGIISRMEKTHFLSKFVNKFHIIYDSIYKLFSLKNTLIAIFMSIISWLFESIALLLVLKGFDVNIPLLKSIFIYNFSTIAGVLSMMPGGIGATEGGLTGLLIMGGITKAVAVSSTLIIRLCTLWFGVFIGIMALSLYRHRFEKTEKCDVTIN